MKYRELLETLMTLPEDVLEQDVTLFDGQEFFEASDFRRADDDMLSDFSDGILDPDNMVLVSINVILALPDKDPAFLEEECDASDEEDEDDENDQDDDDIEEEESDGNMDS